MRVLPAASRGPGGAAMQCTFRFNTVVALGVFYVLLHGEPLGALNCVCHGSSFQVCALLARSATSEVVRTAFEQSWILCFEPPDLIMTDGGQEFGGALA